MGGRVLVDAQGMAKTPRRKLGLKPALLVRYAAAMQIEVAEL